MGEAPSDEVLEDLVTLHEDILEENEEGVKEILSDFADDGLPIVDLVSREMSLGAGDPDFSMTAIHRAAAVGATSVLRSVS